MSDGGQYAIGHSDAVHKSHSLRTAQNSAAYLLPHLKSHHSLLDIGCGPGTITCSFAQILSQGHVIGADMTEDVLSKARQAAKEQNLENATFQVQDIFGLTFEDNTFDVVYCHAVLHHLRDPVAALKEMRRVCKPGGIVACREPDFEGLLMFPAFEGCTKLWLLTKKSIDDATGGNSTFGRRSLAAALKAGFSADQVISSCSGQSFFAPHGSLVWGESSASRCKSGGIREFALKEGVTEAELDQMAQDCLDWGKSQGASWSIPMYEILARK